MVTSGGQVVGHKQLQHVGRPEPYCGRGVRSLVAAIRIVQGDARHWDRDSACGWAVRPYVVRGHQLHAPCLSTPHPRSPRRPLSGRDDAQQHQRVRSRLVPGLGVLPSPKTTAKETTVTVSSLLTPPEIHSRRRIRSSTRKPSSRRGPKATRGGCSPLLVSPSPLRFPQLRRRVFQCPGYLPTYLITFVSPTRYRKGQPSEGKLFVSCMHVTSTSTQLNSSHTQHIPFPPLLAETPTDTNMST